MPQFRKHEIIEQFGFASEEGESFTTPAEYRVCPGAYGGGKPERRFFVT